MSSDEEEDDELAANGGDAPQVPDDALQTSGRHAGDAQGGPGRCALQVAALRRQRPDIHS